MPSNRKIVIVSDVHMGKKEPYSWFLPPYSDYFEAMLNIISEDKGIDELLLLGDIFDLWLYPVNTIPPTLHEIVDEWQDTTIAALQKCADNIPKVYYINGNHDMSVTSKEIAGIHPNIKWISVEDYNNRYKDLIHAEHGNFVDMFNAPDNSPNAPNGLPLGYYLTRIDATAHSTRKGNIKAELAELLIEHHSKYAAGEGDRDTLCRPKEKHNNRKGKGRLRKPSL